MTLGWRWTAVEAAGLYVPGGTASYPSSVLMNAVPARVAGVERVVMVAPTPDGKVNPLVLAAAKVAGVDEVYRVGGAQAIAALAYGTATIRAGGRRSSAPATPGSRRQRRVFGQVGIDMIAPLRGAEVPRRRRAHPDLGTTADRWPRAEHDVPPSRFPETHDSAALPTRS